MNSSELPHLLFRVITSWQVIFVTVALFLYLLLVFYAARVRQRKHPPAYAAGGKASKVKAPRGRSSKTPSKGMSESDDPGAAEQA